jgi:hypothetical protein
MKAASEKYMHTEHFSYYYMPPAKLKGFLSLAM